jgi:hypothetical protein
VRLAETLKRAGKTAEATAVYRAIKEGNAPTPQKSAAELALRG